MKKNRHIYFFCLLLLATIWISANYLKAGSFYKEYLTSVSIRLKGGGVKEEELKKALEQEETMGTQVPGVTAWNLIKEEKVKNTYLNREEKVTAFLVSGDMKLASDASLICGNYVYKEDYDGCILDSDTAYSLFGTVQGVNNRVFYGNNSYNIRGIVKSRIPLIMIQGKDPSLEYSNLEFQYESTSLAERKTTDFLARYNLTDDYTCIDGYFYGGFLHSVLGLPVWASYIIVSISLLRKIFLWKGSVDKDKFLYYLCFGVIIVGYGVLLYQTGGNPMYIPEKIIPTRWSDFDYWTRLFRSTEQQIEQIRFLPPSPRDLLLEEGLLTLKLRCTLLNILYIVVYLVGKNLKLSGSCIP